MNLMRACIRTQMSKVIFN